MRSPPRQFSLRKLILWTAACAIYLGGLRIVSLEPVQAITLTIWLFVLLGVRFFFSVKRGLLIVVLAAFPFALLVLPAILTDLFQPLPEIYFNLLIFALYILGSFLGVCGVVSVVNWLDNLGQTGSTETAEVAENDNK